MLQRKGKDTMPAAPKPRHLLGRLPRKSNLLHQRAGLPPRAPQANPPRNSTTPVPAPSGTPSPDTQPCGRDRLHPTPGVRPDRRHASRKPSRLAGQRTLPRFDGAPASVFPGADARALDAVSRHAVPRPRHVPTDLDPRGQRPAGCRRATAAAQHHGPAAQDHHQPRRRRGGAD